MTKTLLLISALSLLAGCARSPKLDISMSLDKQKPDLIFVKVKIVNTEDRATVPIAVEITGQAESNGQWGKSDTLLHPAAFVLNKKEQREITKLWRVTADVARTTLTVKEQESGKLLKTERSEKVFPPVPGTPANATANP
jgi:uncharacterized lipoprotein YajG